MQEYLLSRSRKIWFRNGEADINSEISFNYNPGTFLSESPVLREIPPRFALFHDRSSAQFLFLLSREMSRLRLANGEARKKATPPRLSSCCSVSSSIDNPRPAIVAERSPSKVAIVVESLTSARRSPCTLGQS